MSEDAGLWSPASSDTLPILLTNLVPTVRLCSLFSLQEKVTVTKGDSHLFSMKVLRTYSDGGARGNPGPGAIGVLVCDEKGGVLERHQDLIGNTTNNVAEYCALIAALELARVLKAREVTSFVDSELIVRQMEGRYRTKSSHIQALYQEVKKLEKKFKKVSYVHLPRTHEKMKIVDRMVNDALDKKGSDPFFEKGV